MTAVFPIARLGCTTLDRGQAYAYWKRAIRVKTITDECCRYPIMSNDCSCWADFPDTPYVDPITDCAAWYDPNNVESAKFFGVWITSVEGLDDPVIGRSTSPLLNGGLSIGGMSIGGRLITIKGMILSQDSQGMAWGQQWFRRFLVDSCRWQPGTSDCEGGSLFLRPWCPIVGADDLLGIVELVNVGVAEQPKYSAIVTNGRPCNDHIQLWEATIICGNPRAYWPKQTAMASVTLTGGSARTNNITGCTDDYDPFYSTDLPLVRVLPPVGGGTLPDFDINGRPSCGPNSGLFDSGYETIVTDVNGHPSAGPGSRDYLRTSPEFPFYDWQGRPSCGTASANYSAYPSTGSTGAIQIASTVGNTTAPTPPWSVTQVARIEGLTNLQVQAIYFQFRTAAGNAYVRDVTFKLFARNDYGNPTTYQIWTSGPFSAVSGTMVGTSATLYGAFGGVNIPRGYLGDVEMSWQQQVGNTIQLITEYAIPAESAVASPNGGADRACNPSIPGPNWSLFPTDRPIGTGCISQLVALPYTWTNLDLSGALSPYQGDAASLLHSVLSPEGEQISGLITPNGQAAFTLQNFVLSSICSGSALHWARLRVRFSTPKGPGDTLHPWSVYIRDAAGNFLGGKNQVLEEREDGESVYLINLPFVWFTPPDLWVVVNLAAPPGGTPGSLDYAALEFEYYGGTGCLDCGPNNGIDAICAASDYWVDPVSLKVRDANYTPPNGHPAHPVITINSGSSKLYYTRIRAWPNYVGRNGPSVSDTDWLYWFCLDNCLTYEITELDANSTLVIDSRRQKITLTRFGRTIDGSSYVRGYGGSAFTWPEINQKTLFTAQTSNDAGFQPAADATVLIEAYPYEGL